MRLLEVDLAGRRVEGDPSPGRKIGPQEFVDTRLNPAAVGTGDDPVNDRLHKPARGDLYQTELRAHHAHEWRPGPLASPRQRRRQQGQASDTLGVS